MHFSTILPEKSIQKQGVIKIGVDTGGNNQKLFEFPKKTLDNFEKDVIIIQV
jgi:hypothetical protein